MKDKYHHGDLKTELMKAGIAMIQEVGVDKVSLRGLAKFCNVSEAAPYSHFKNKEDLLSSIHEYVTNQLQEELTRAYDETVPAGTPIAIMNMGKAYVLFFIKNPEYFTFLFSLPNTKIDLSMKGGPQEFGPFQYFRDKTYEVYRKEEGYTEERIKYGIICMWATVHGVASIASMKGVTKDFEWDEVLEKVLVNQ